MKATINSLKHYVPIPLSTATSGARVLTPLAVAIEVPGTDAQNVRIGAVVKAIYIELWVRAGSTSPGNYIIVFGKGSAGSGGPTFGEMANMHDFNEKSDVLFISQALTNDQDADAIPVMRGWYKIPKGKQRMAIGQQWYVGVSAPAIDVIFCGQVVYKEYY